MQIETARHQMIYHQIRPWDVSDERVLAAMGTVPRERFVPDKYSALAFADTAIPLPCGQSMLKPILEGRLLQALQAEPQDHALVIGTGSGYTSACLAQLVDHVTSVDIHAELVDAAAVRLADEKVRNVDLKLADFFEFKPTKQFDCILVAGSTPIFDARLPEWLTDKGRLITITGKAPSMSVELVTRDNNTYSRNCFIETVVQALENAPAPESFHF
jgi:protein-L-isoaspartate(D-aspartate) O-methyltransferase